MCMNTQVESRVDFLWYLQLRNNILGLKEFQLELTPVVSLMVDRESVKRGVGGV